MKRIGVLTSGSDSPGLNPCLRAVVRTACEIGLEIMGIEHGYEGLMRGEFVNLTDRSVSGIVGKGGTFLGASRSLDFRARRGQIDALRNLNAAEIEGLVVIGGDGTMHGALQLEDLGFPVIGVPSTIENDVPYTDMAIGVDTALNTALDAIDKIKDTASSHHRAFLVQVMGRDSGYLALMTGIAGGAEQVCIPEVPFELDEVANTITSAYIKGKSHCIIVVAEGAQPGLEQIAAFLNERREDAGFTVRLAILGYIQRGGAPSAFDRLLATRLGAAATRRLAEGHRGEMVGLQGREIAFTLLRKICAERKGVDMNMFRVAETLAR